MDASFCSVTIHDTNSCSCVVVLRCGISEYYNHSQTLCCLRSVAYLSDDDGTGDDVTVGSCVKPPRWGDASFGKHLMSLSHESRSSVNVFPVPFVHTHIATFEQNCCNSRWNTTWIMRYHFSAYCNVLSRRLLYTKRALQIDRTGPESCNVCSACISIAHARLSVFTIDTFSNCLRLLLISLSASSSS